MFLVGTASAIHACSRCSGWAGDVWWRLHFYGRKRAGD